MGRKHAFEGAYVRQVPRTFIEVQKLSSWSFEAQKLSSCDRRSWHNKGHTKSSPNVTPKVVKVYQASGEDH